MKIVRMRISVVRVPTSIQKALKDENWVQAMNVETLEKKQTSEILDRP